MEVEINLSKSSFLTISLKKNQIPSTYFIVDNHTAKISSQKGLGVVFDEKLLFPDHVTSVTNSFMRLLGLLYRFAEIKDVPLLSKYYTPFISRRI